MPINLQRRTAPVIGSPEWIETFLHRRWEVSRRGTVYINIQAHNVAIIEDYNDAGQWKIRIKDSCGFETWFEERYPNVEDAKRAALEHLVEML
jgi:hypothetical protein